MRLKIVFRFLALISVVISCSMLFPLFWALKDGTGDSNSFVLSIGVGFVMSGLLFYAGKGAKPQDVSLKQTFILTPEFYVLNRLFQKRIIIQH